MFSKSDDVEATASSKRGWSISAIARAAATESTWRTPPAPVRVNAAWSWRKPSEAATARSCAVRTSAAAVSSAVPHSAETVVGGRR